jgi:glycosyltransferase involved in cell wall biosynthesis
VKFSIIIPTYNEEKDISETIEAVLALDYANKEILVVDDSTDSTPDIVRSYSPKGVRLIRGSGGGRCEARNAGIMEATGEIVVILNADVRPKTDFLTRLVPYYAQGYDYVLVLSRVTNDEALFARYVEAISVRDYFSCDPSWMEWTEGFSCRRDMAIKAGMFPTGYPVAICAGEDGYFGTNLRNIGARKKMDLSIVVEHVAPGLLSEYWHTRKGRLKGGVLLRRFVHKWTIPMLAAWALLRVGQTVVLTLPILPVMFICWRIAPYSSRGVRDFLPFIGAWLIERAAFHVGEWEGIAQVSRCSTWLGYQQSGTVSR